MGFFDSTTPQPPVPNTNEEQKTNAAFGSDLASVAPPPPEVSVRTMESDVKHLATLGGGSMPRFMSVPVVKRRGDQVLRPGSLWGRRLAVVLILLLALAVLFLVGYYLATSVHVDGLPFFGTASSSKNTAFQPPIVPLSPQTPLPSPAQPAPLTIHQSYFSKSADQALLFTPEAAATNVLDLQSYPQKLATLLGSASGAFLEIQMQNVNGSPKSALDVFSLINAPIFDRTFLNTNFTPDITFFALKKNGVSSLGYILKPQQDKSVLLLKDGVATKVETASAEAIANLYLASPGERASNSFNNSSVAGQATRVLQFKAPDVAFEYGWFHGYLVLATSDEALHAAADRL